MRPHARRPGPPCGADPCELQQLVQHRSIPDRSERGCRSGGHGRLRVNEPLSKSLHCIARAEAAQRASRALAKVRGLGGERFADEGRVTGVADVAEELDRTPP